MRQYIYIYVCVNIRQYIYIYIFRHVYFQDCQLVECAFSYEKKSQRFPSDGVAQDESLPDLAGFIKSDGFQEIG